ncbi:hypothetical protein HGB13_04635 [bacterium]|nr:hypothetical protein [bacterium]
MGDVVMNSDQDRIHALDEAIRNHSFRPRYIILEAGLLRNLVDLRRVNYGKFLGFNLGIMDGDHPDGAIIVHTQQPPMNNKALEDFENIGFLLPTVDIQ